MSHSLNVSGTNVFGVYASDWHALINNIRMPEIDFGSDRNINNIRILRGSQPFLLKEKQFMECKNLEKVQKCPHW